MKDIYLLTGTTGHLGTVLIDELKRRNKKIRALVLPGEESLLPGVPEVFMGDVRDIDSMRPFFNIVGHDRAILIHCAAVITIASETDPDVWDTNVNGTDNVMKLALENGIDRVIHVSSVHAIPEKKDGIIQEIRNFSEDSVYGQYARSKAAASAIVLGYADKGLNVSIVHPSGITGPGDLYHNNRVIRTINFLYDHSLPFYLDGGYDFVDSRDVAEGILNCADLGKKGECYILTGEYISVKELTDLLRELRGKGKSYIRIPLSLARAAAPLAEKITMMFTDRPSVFTPYSIETLNSSGRFSHDKATRELGYAPRDIRSSMRDSIYK